jgi:hypothetical protein
MLGSSSEVSVILPTPNRCHTMPRPNLFIIGAMKAGTSSLHAYLGTHPQIFMSEPKEPAFFEDPRERGRQKEGRGYWNDLDLYLQLFHAAGDRLIVGEATTDYTKLPRKTGVARRLFAFNPEARLIYLVRDPIDRTFSHYWWEVWNGEETRDIFTAITQDRFYRDVSDYAMQLEPYLDLFSREQIKVVTFEKLIASPLDTIQDLFRWLDVDASFQPPNLHSRVNDTPQELLQLRKKGLLHRVRQSRLGDTISDYLPRWVRLLGRKIIERRVDRSKVPVQAAAEFLRPIQMSQTARLSNLLGRGFPEWKRLHAHAETKGRLVGAPE